MARPTTWSRTPPRRLGALLAVVLALVAAGCGGDDDVEQSIAALYAPGTCFNFSDDGGGLIADEEHVVDCATPHDGEVFGSTTFPGAPEGTAFPGGDTLRDFATTECDTAFETYTGAPRSSFDVEVNRLVPTEDTWGAGDRLILCAASRPDQLTGSIAGVGSSTTTAAAGAPAPGTTAPA